MDDKIYNELGREVHTLMHRKLLDHCKGLVDMSRNTMSQYYCAWDIQQCIYDADVTTTEKDVRASKDGKPTSQTIPLIYTKMDTFVSFCMTVFTQKDKIFEMDPIGAEDEALVLPIETCLERDLRRSKFNLHLKKMSKNVAKFGLGVLKDSWEKEYGYISVEKMVGEKTILGVSFGGKMETVYEKVLKFEGNTVQSLDPYKFFPDTRHNLSELNKGEFCASEVEMSKLDLQERELSKQVAGIEHVGHFSEVQQGRRRNKSRFTSIRLEDNETTGNITCVTEVQVKIIPNNYELEDGTKLGPQTHPVMYLVWMANDDRLIRLEPMDYLHGKFGYNAAEFDSDDNSFISGGIGKKLIKLQETIDWFVNSRVEAVTRTIDNQLIVDPLGVDMNSIMNRDRIIKLKKGAARTGVDRYIKQLNVQDTTQNHMNDVNELKALMQAVSGVNENASGQYAKGRRSATESRVVTRSGSARLLTVVMDMWVGCIAPCGAKLVTNLRQGLSYESYISLCGGALVDRKGLTDESEIQQLMQTSYSAFRSTPSNLMKQEDLFIFDGSLPSEKEYLAQSLQEVLGMLMSNPNAAMQNDLSPKLLLRKIYELRGVKNLGDMSLSGDPQSMQRMVEQQVQQAIQGAVESGQLVPKEVVTELEYKHEHQLALANNKPHDSE